jgi:hypothetical protein
MALELRTSDLAAIESLLPPSGELAANRRARGAHTAQMTERKDTCRSVRNAASDNRNPGWLICDE